MPPNHHKEIAKFLAEKTEGNPSVHEYRDNDGNRPVPVGCFGGSLYSTIGACDTSYNVPNGCFEFAAFGKSKWLPNAIVTSIYWLKDRTFSNWPVVCEDAVKQNAKSKSRHMAFCPSPFKLVVSTGQNVQWLLGVPIPDAEIGSAVEQIEQKAKELYPRWLFSEFA
ncbi:MAG: hypothetical protein C9356_09300 [Oleiphilus sp.]|nr:MAG: hypothetical protein C9356_09300 [Oleiphilus sp.]